jgi:integrase/recombinase XerC
MFLERFFNYLSYEKRYSPHTLISYKKDISQYLNFLKDSESDYLIANHLVIRSWIVSLISDGLEPRSINRKISSLKSLYKFLIKEGAIEQNPTLKVQSPKVSKKLPAFVEDVKLNELLDRDYFTDDFSGRRDKLIIELLFGTGIRLSELVGLEINKLDLEVKTVKVLGKRNKERILPVTITLTNLLTEYLTMRGKVVTNNNLQALFVTDKGDAIYPKFVYRVVHKYLSLITTQDQKSPHILRHTFATALLNKGADINAIKELLGHASLAATQVYTHNSIERIKSIYKQAHPKAN